MTRQAVIFDMDGVLVDSRDAHFRSWVLLADEIGHEMTEAQFVATFGRTSRDILRDLWDVPAERVAELDDRKEELYRQLIEQDFPQMDGAGELIAALHADGFALAIGSSGPPRNVQAVLRHLGHGDLLSATVDGTQVIHGKPHPEVFLKAAGKLGVSPSDCLVVEDALTGLAAARAGGMASAALVGSRPRHELQGHADIVVDSLRELSPQVLRDCIRRRAGR